MSGSDLSASASLFASRWMLASSLLKLVQPACRTCSRRFNSAPLLRASHTAARPAPRRRPPPSAASASAPVNFAPRTASAHPAAKMTKVDRAQQNAAHAAKIQRDFRTCVAALSLSLAPFCGLSSSAAEARSGPHRHARSRACCAPTSVSEATELVRSTPRPRVVRTSR